MSTHKVGSCEKERFSIWRYILFWISKVAEIGGYRNTCYFQLMFICVKTINFCSSIWHMLSMFYQYCKYHQLNQSFLIGFTTLELCFINVVTLHNCYSVMDFILLLMFMLLRVVYHRLILNAYNKTFLVKNCPR